MLQTLALMILFSHPTAEWSGEVSFFDIMVSASSDGDPAFAMAWTAKEWVKPCPSHLKCDVGAKLGGGTANLEALQTWVDNNADGPADLRSLIFVGYNAAGEEVLHGVATAAYPYKLRYSDADISGALVEFRSINLLLDGISLE